MNNIQYNLGTMHQTLEGAFKVSVVDATTNEIVWEQSDYTKNLILNSGLNNVPYQAYANLMLNGIAGTGTRVNSAYGNTAVVSQAGTTVTLVPDPSFISFTQSLAGYPGGTMEAGDTIVFDAPANGVSAVQVVGSITGTTCQVSKTVSISSTTFTVWKTSQVGLQAEFKRAGQNVSNTSLLTGAANCGSTWAGNVLSMKRTWDFAPEASPVDYEEVGVGWDWTVGNPGHTFSRLLLPATVHVDTNQRIRLAYQLQVTINPTSSVSRPDASITGWTYVSPTGSTTQGSESIQDVFTGTQDGEGRWQDQYALLSYVDYSGVSAGQTTLEPSSAGQTCMFWLSTVSTPLQSFDTSVDRQAGATYSGLDGLGTVATYQNAYVLNSYTINKSATHGQAVRTGICSMGFGFGFYSNGWYYIPTAVGEQAFCFVFDYPQQTTNTQTLTLSYTWTWDRSYVA